jgi:hypothetical protein
MAELEFELYSPTSAARIAVSAALTASASSGANFAAFETLGAAAAADPAFRLAPPPGVVCLRPMEIPPWSERCFAPATAALAPM